MVSGSDYLQIWGVQLIRGRIQRYVISYGLITHYFDTFGIVDRMR